MMSSQKQREDKLHEINDLLRRCHNEAVYHLLLDERERIKRDVEKYSKAHDHEKRRSHYHGDKRKARSHSSFDDIPDHKRNEKERTLQQKSATLDPKMKSRNLPAASESPVKSSAKKEHRKERVRPDTVKRKPTKHAESNGEAIANTKSLLEERKSKEHVRSKGETPETKESKRAVSKLEPQQGKTTPGDKSSETGMPHKQEKNRKPKSKKKAKTPENGLKSNISATAKPADTATREKDITNNHKPKTKQPIKEKTGTEVKSIRPKDLPVKEFTADEIAQMSKNHRSKQLPPFVQKEIVESETNRTRVAKSPTIPQPKAATWNEVSPKSSAGKLGTLPKTEKTESVVQQPVIQTLRRGDELNVSSGSSTISSRLMKLKQSDRRPNRYTKRPTQSNGAVDTNKNERDGNKISNPKPVTQGKEFNETKSKSLKSKTKVHKLLRWQQSSPAALENDKQPRYLDIGNMSENERMVENHKVEEQREKNPEVVFRVDLDDLNRRNSKTRGFSSFFRQRVMRTKSTERKQISTKECETQTSPWEIPALLLEQATQTANIEILSASTQTFSAGQVATTQTQHKKHHDVSIQFEPRCSTIETQTTSSGVPSETQTEDEDSPVWGNSNRLSLDRLVRTRGRRKVKMKRASSQDEISTGSQEFDESVLKRATTLPHGGAKEEKKSKHKITSFNWTQTDKFIKITISYSGAHLIPNDKIKVTTNGINFRLKINSDEASTSNTSNSNNSNNSSQDIIPAELYICRLRYFVSGLSYTVLPDMLTVLLRKQKIQNWDSLEFTGTERTVIENV